MFWRDHAPEICMIDLHTHTFLSDGALCPAEHIRRAETKKYRILGLADHADLSLLSRLLPPLLEAARRENELGRMEVLAGIELTHVRPQHIAEAANLARELGAQYVIVHGETIAEPVLSGTNRAAIEAGVDILAHPGLITPEDAALAARNNVLLEVSGKSGHSLCNGHVVQTARTAGAQLIFGSDAHTPEQMTTREFAESICLGAGLHAEEIAAMFNHAEQFARQKALQGGINRRSW
jgi:histidinol phosphatase-like PHP family hydrolase